MKNNAARVGRFLLAGGFGAITYFVVSTLICRGGISPWIASGVTYLGLIPVIYYIQKTFVFSSGALHVDAFPRYVCTQAASFCISIALPLVLADFAIRPEVSFGLVVIVSGAVGYILQSRWAFPSS